MRENKSNNPSTKSHIKRLMVIQTFSGFSQWIDIFLIFSIPSFLWQSTPKDIALVAACLGLPSLFLGPFIGTIIDRVNPVRMAIHGAISRSILSLLIAFAGTLEVFAILVVLKGIANLCYWPATTVMTNHMVSQETRVSYYSSLSALDQITKIATPLVAGLLAHLIGLQSMFIISAITTLLCTCMLVSISKKIPQYTPAHNDRNSIFKDFRAGFGSIKLLPVNLISGIFLSIGISFTLAVYDPHLAAYLKANQLGTSSFSLIVSSTAAGAVSGAVLTRYFFKELKPRTLIRIGIFLFFSALSVFSTIASTLAEILDTAALSIIWFFNGMGYEIFIIGNSVNHQNLCPRHLLGRVSTSIRSFQMLATVTAPIIGSYLIVHHTRTAPFIASALLAMACFIVSLMAFSSNDFQGHEEKDAR